MASFEFQGTCRGGESSGSAQEALGRFLEEAGGNGIGYSVTPEGEAKGSVAAFGRGPLRVEQLPRILDAIHELPISIETARFGDQTHLSGFSHVEARYEGETRFGSMERRSDAGDVLHALLRRVRGAAVSWMETTLLQGEEEKGPEMLEVKATGREHAGPAAAEEERQAFARTLAEALVSIGVPVAEGQVRSEVMTKPL